MKELGSVERLNNHFNMSLDPVMLKRLHQFNNIPSIYKQKRSESLEWGGSIYQQPQGPVNKRLEISSKLTKNKKKKKSK